MSANVVTDTEEQEPVVREEVEQEEEEEEEVVPVPALSGLREGWKGYDDSKNHASVVCYYRVGATPEAG